MQREHEVLSGNSPRPYVTWCPFCREWCDFDDEGLAEGLAENHDENYHDGKAASFVLDNSDDLSRGEA